jgi:hypothetical protein
LKTTAIPCLADFVIPVPEAVQWSGRSESKNKNRVTG